MKAEPLAGRNLARRDFPDRSSMCQRRRIRCAEPVDVGLHAAAVVLGWTWTASLSVVSSHASIAPVEKDSKTAVRYIFIDGFGYQPSVLFLVSVS